jgi:drug/metabolite transporter (DMT)-like permease
MVFLKTENETKSAVFQAFLAALLFGINAPFAKLLLNNNIPPIYMAALLYLGAGLGMSLVWLLTVKSVHRPREANVDRSDRIWIILMIILDILAPFLLMTGLTQTSAATASLLNNFEMVTTALIALLLFKEAIGRRVWISIALITVASIFLSVDFQSVTDISFSKGSLLVLGACLCWGMENNCTRNLSAKNPIQIVMIKGFGSGLGALVLALSIQVHFSINPLAVIGALLLGFVSYGLSIFFYVRAQRWLGAARTSMYYAVAPFVGVLISFLVFSEMPGISFFIGTLFMIAGTVLAMKEKHMHRHQHTFMIHEHPHHHQDGHHNHEHSVDISQESTHSHPHEHQPIEHEHGHQPDIHHRHQHD